MTDIILRPPTRHQIRAAKISSHIVLEPPEQISFQHTVLCQTSMPYRNQGDNIREWERVQGNVYLRIEAGAAKHPGQNQSGDSSELALGLPCKGKSVRNRGVSQIMPFLVIPRSLLRGGFIG